MALVVDNLFEPEQMTNRGIHDAGILLRGWWETSTDDKGDPDQVADDVAGRMLGLAASAAGVRAQGGSDGG